MGKLVKVRRKYFTKAQKISILNELNISGVSLSELARKYQINSVVLYRWKRSGLRPKSWTDFHESLV